MRSEAEQRVLVAGVAGSRRWEAGASGAHRRKRVVLDGSHWRCSSGVSRGWPPLARGSASGDGGESCRRGRRTMARGRGGAEARRRGCAVALSVPGEAALETSPRRRRDGRSSTGRHAGAGPRASGARRRHGGRRPAERRALGSRRRPREGEGVEGDEGDRAGWLSWLDACVRRCEEEQGDGNRAQGSWRRGGDEQEATGSSREG